MEINDDQTTKNIAVSREWIYGKSGGQEALTHKNTLQLELNAQDTRLNNVNLLENLGGRSRSCVSKTCQCNSLKQKL